MNFDLISPVYDILARLVFGKNWKQIQRTYHDRLSKTEHVLVVGGGSGHVLKGLRASQITFVDNSAKMMLRAKKHFNRPGIFFVNEDFLTWKTDEKFEAIVFPFFLDCFQPKDILKIMDQICSLLKPKGQVYVIDFKKSRRWHGAFIWSMYLFFRLTVRLRARKLPEIEVLLGNAGFSEVAVSQFYNGLIFYKIFELKS